MPKSEQSECNKLRLRSWKRRRRRNSRSSMLLGGLLYDTACVPCCMFASSFSLVFSLLIGDGMALEVASPFYARAHMCYAVHTHPRMCVHTRTHTHTNVRTHTHTNPHAHGYTQMQTNSTHNTPSRIRNTIHNSIHSHTFIFT